MTIHAYTEPQGPLPAYVNVSERPLNPRDVVLTVRGLGENNASVIILNREHAVALASDILSHYQAPIPAVKEMVDRFLGWPIPTTFAPDCGISFDGRKDDEWNKNKPWPVGTNLFNAEEARAMFEHALQLDGEKQVSNEEEATPEVVLAEFRRMTALLGEQVELMKESRVEHREAMARYDAMTDAYQGGSKVVADE